MPSADIAPKVQIRPTNRRDGADQRRAPATGTAPATTTRQIRIADGSRKQEILKHRRRDRALERGQPDRRDSNPGSAVAKRGVEQVCAGLGAVSRVGDHRDQRGGAVGDITWRARGDWCACARSRRAASGRPARSGRARKTAGLAVRVGDGEHADHPGDAVGERRSITRSSSAQPARPRRRNRRPAP